MRCLRGQAPLTLGRCEQLPSSCGCPPPPHPSWPRRMQQAIRRGPSGATAQVTASLGLPLRRWYIYLEDRSSYVFAVPKVPCLWPRYWLGAWPRKTSHPFCCRLQILRSSVTLCCCME